MVNNVFEQRIGILTIDSRLRVVPPVHAILVLSFDLAHKSTALHVRFRCRWRELHSIPCLHKFGQIHTDSQTASTFKRNNCQQDQSKNTEKRRVAYR